MEDIARQLFAERNALQEQVLKLTREAESAQKLLSNEKTDKKRLQAELRQQRDNNQALQVRINLLERKRTLVAAPSRRRSPSIEIIEKPSCLRPQPLPLVPKTEGGTPASATAGPSRTTSSTANIIKVVQKQDIDMEVSEFLADSRPPRAALQPAADASRGSCSSTSTAVQAQVPEIEQKDLTEGHDHGFQSNIGRESLPLSVGDPVSTALVPSPKRSRDGTPTLKDPTAGPHMKRRKQSVFSEPSSSMVDSEMPISDQTTLHVSQAQNSEVRYYRRKHVNFSQTCDSTDFIACPEPASWAIRGDVQMAQPCNEEVPPNDKLNADVQLKAKAFSLPPSNVNAYLSLTPTLTISPPASCPAVPGDFVRFAYGGRNMLGVQFVDANRNISSDPTPRMRRIFWPTITTNPSMPQHPGAPGLLIGSQHDILHDGPWTVFCPDMTNKKHKRWIYLGEYESEIVGQLTAEEFSSQEVNVKDEWGKRLMSRSQITNIELYLRMQSRIAGNDAEDNEAVAEEMRNVRAFGGSPVDKADIIRAFERGEERIDIIRMKCVFYDHVFANDMNERLKEYLDTRKENAKTAELAKRLSSKKAESKQAEDANKASRPSTPDSEETASASAVAGPGPETTPGLRRSNRARVSIYSGLNISALGYSDDSWDSDTDSDPYMDSDDSDYA
ncbi:hypothetical protein BKA70DRAFT_1439759 [Coprinopsis sp. MPI-PUGE-AT-0042]|nr:hypothetical protein BKA70DRAFT_1439759 [Coprinopsis sp. MPI-PUGE-AT-0042]